MKLREEFIYLNLEREGEGSGVRFFFNVELIRSWSWLFLRIGVLYK